MKATPKIAADTKLTRVYQLLHDQISRGKVKAGERLPTEHELASKMGYSPSTIAAAMRLLVQQGLIERRKRAGTFVQAKPSTAARFFGAIVYRALPIYPENVFATISQEIGRQMEVAGCGLLLHDPAYNTCETAPEIAAQHKRITRRLIQHKVAGVFILPQEIEDDQKESLSTIAIEKFDKAKIPVVLLDRDIYRYPQRSNMDVVAIDNQRAGYVITEHLLSLGRRRIDFVATTSSYSSAGHRRIEGYQCALKAHGINPQSRTVHYSNRFSPELDQKILRSDADALVCMNDSAADRIMRAALALGRRIPEDLSIVGFDDLPHSQSLPVPLTTIRQPAGEIGQQATLAMFERLKNPHRGALDVHVQFQLVIRRSCGARR